MNDILNSITPFLVKTTAIMSAVIILTILIVFMVSTEREINKETVEKTIKTVKQSIKWLLILEGFTAFLEFVYKLFYFLTPLIMGK